MTTIATVLAALVAVIHVYVLVLEMFLWTKPAGRRAFGLTAEQAEQSKVLAMNQGQMLALGTPAEVQRHPGVVEAYLGAADDVSSLRRVAAEVAR